MNTYVRNTSKIAVWSLLLVLAYSCSTQKDTAANRKLQNLSAKYNLIYNANVLLTEYEEGLSQSNSENFNILLPMYYAPEVADAATAGTKITVLDDIDQKARMIIAEKNFSKYIDEAYILLGKTNFYQGKYYNANAYFDYVAEAFKNDHSVYLNALNLKARSAIALNDLKIAEKILDTVMVELDSVKRGKSEPLATLAQFSVINGIDKQAIEYLEAALKAKPSSANRKRWTYTLAQLYENEEQYEKSLAAYHKVEKSNASFEMYFNAKLSKIRITEKLNGRDFDRKQQLTRMLKDDKNADFKDQIYYEIAEDYFDIKDFSQAEKYYNLGIRNSTVNNGQKALSYLKLADLNFKEYNNYVNAKLYYDSTVTFLPKTHPFYATIVTKADNLAYLKDRYETIALQDTLQRIAALPESERALAVSNYFAVRSLPVIEQENLNSGSAVVNNFKPESGGIFYFSNATAISKGFNEFKKRWGNRKLENNWRQSVKSNNQNQQAALDLGDVGPGSLPSDPDVVVPIVLDATAKSALYVDSIPLTPALLALSNQKIIASYLEIGAFYQQVLKDKPEAIKTYETLLERFPNNENLATIYYSLYLAYQGTNNAESVKYKDLVLNNYASSNFAKSIIDPNFSMKQNQLEIVLNTEYESLFKGLQEKNYRTVIADAKKVSQRFPGNVMEPQFEYLKAIAIGQTENVDQLMVAFKTITDKYKTDKLITPLVEQHLLYINANLSDFKKRKIALKSNTGKNLALNEMDIVLLDEPIIANLQNPTGGKVIRGNVKPAEQIVAAQKPGVKKENKQTVLPRKENEISTTVDTKEVVIAPAKRPVVKDDLFSPASSTNYYYVVAVNTVNLSVSSSRFGIGQFNRGNYAGTNLRHQLKELDKDQIIIVGDFNSANTVSDYAENIKTQLPVIIKIPAANYTTFAISKENLDKITNSQILERYIRYINNNEL